MFGPSKSVKTYALLDDGSTITLINKRVAREIGVKGKHVRLALKGINDREAVYTQCEKVSFQIAGEFEKHQIQNAIAVADLCLPSQTLSREAVRHVARTESVFIQPYEKVKPEIVIGQDNWRLIASRETRAVRDSMLALTSTALGWAVHGGTRECSENSERAACAQGQWAVYGAGPRDAAAERDTRCDRLIKEYFSLENLGVQGIVRPNAKHVRACNILESTTRRVDSVWETGLLWKEFSGPDIDSRKLAMRRLLWLEKRLDRDEEYAEMYYKEMQRLTDCGYARKVEDDVSRNRIWYLPHFGVTNPNKPGKIRIVFDAAAKSEGVSLNDQLDTGPDLLRPLIGVLLRFRLYAIAVKADIADMYMRVNVIESDRGAQRFLWRGKSRKGEPLVYEMTCILFGAKPSQCSAIYVKDKNADLFKHSKPDAVESIKYDSYADDFLSSRKTVEEAATLVRDVIEINSKANFSMHGWASNDERAISAASEAARAAKALKTSLCDRG